MIFHNRASRDWKKFWSLHHFWIFYKGRYWNEKDTELLECYIIRFRHQLRLLNCYWCNFSPIKSEHSWKGSASFLPWYSGPIAVINAPKNFPRHWWTSVIEGGVRNNRSITTPSDWLTNCLNIGPPESAINVNPCKDQTYVKKLKTFAC